jgi:hypothetical protein
MFPSRKNHQIFMCATRTQADFCVYLEHLSNVEGYCVRPGKLYFHAGDFYITPDIVTKLTNGQCVFYKIFDYPLPDGAPEKRREIVAQANFARAGLRLIILSADQFGSMARTANLKYLYHHSHNGSMTAAEELTQRIQNNHNGNCTIRELLRCGESAISTSLALFVGYLNINLERAIRLDSLVSVPQYEHQA